MPYASDDASGRPLIEHAMAPFVRFSRLSASGGIVLAACAAIALYLANSGYADAYFSLWETPFSVGFGDLALSKPLILWINDGLMAVFFFLVGLEIKREILAGELSGAREAFLPIAAAVGGMVVPAGVYMYFNHGLESASGWGTPMATDIAFALGALSLLGSRVPPTLKVFLAAVAIVDDIGAVLVIAIFYSSGVSMTMLGLGFAVFALMVAANLAGARSPLVYLPLGALMWLFFLKSGVHATVAGVLAAMTIPASVRIRAGDFVRRAKSLLDRFENAAISGIGSARAGRRGPLCDKVQSAALEELEEACGKANAPLQRIEHGLQPWTAFVIMPVFALANAGVVLDGSLGDVLAAPEAMGIFLGLVIGKQIGVFGACYALFKLKLAGMGSGLRLSHYYGAACLAGVGFTMSIFIAGLAFEDGGELHRQAKIGVLAASAVSALAGIAVLRFAGGKDS